MTDYDFMCACVCSLQGDTLETGHYTAACRNPYDHRWYKFDDQRVNQVPSDQVEAEIINNEAYILFYQRRKVPGKEPVENSGAEKTTSSADHWISRLSPNLLPLPSVVVPCKKVEPARDAAPPPVTLKEEQVTEKKEDLIPPPLPDVKVNGGDENDDNCERDSSDNEASPDVMTDQVMGTVLAAEEHVTREVSEEVDEAEEDTKKLEEMGGDVTAKTTLDTRDVVIQEEEAEVEKEAKVAVVVVKPSSPIPIRRKTRASPPSWPRTPLWFDEAAVTNGGVRQSSLNYSKAMDLDSAMSVLRASSSCGKDTFMFMDQQGQCSLMENDSLLGAANHSLWVRQYRSQIMAFAIT